MTDRLIVLADDVETRLRQQVMDVGNSAAKGVLDRDHRQITVALFHGGEGLSKRVVADRFHVGVRRRAGHVRVGAWDALECDALSFNHHLTLLVAIEAPRIQCGT